MTVPWTGPIGAPFLILGEAPGETEVKEGIPFVGASGVELTKMLAEVGISRNDCRIGNVCNERPPQNKIEAFFATKTEAKREGIPLVLGRYPRAPVAAGLQSLEKEVRESPPKIILALGDTALWATTGLSGRGAKGPGITKWRGSMLHYREGGTGTRLIGTFHPAAVLREWGLRYIAVHDMRRASIHIETPWPTRPQHFSICRDFNHALSSLLLLKRELDSLSEEKWLSVDIETRAGNIACVGIATSPEDAFCIPFMIGNVGKRNSQWTLDEEFLLVKALRAVLTHERAFVIGQNFLYDSQYFAKLFGFIPRCRFDTMLAQHAFLPGETPKDLNFLSSLYCKQHFFWKDDGKEWEHGSEDDLWYYNCEDAVRTFECAQALDRVLQSQQLYGVFNFFMTMFQRALRVMLRGVNWDRKLQAEFGMTLISMIDKNSAAIERLVPKEYPRGKTPFYNSPQQFADLLYNWLGAPPCFDKDSGRITTDDDALRRTIRKDPLLKPLCERVLKQRSLRVYYKNFVARPIDLDGRIRCSYNVGGTENGRMSSSVDAFGYGMNLQNIARDPEDNEDAYLHDLPNVRRLFRPDPGFILFDIDLKGADAQCVAWEADDPILKDIFRSGKDLHIENARAIYGACEGKRDPKRQMAKNGVHATNYGVYAKKLAQTLRCSVSAAQAFIDRWFLLHPQIKKWQESIELALQTTRTLTNPFGFRRMFLGRMSPKLIQEGLAWGPASTVAFLCNTGWDNIDRNVPEAQVLLQNHDSLVGQFPRAMYPAILPTLHAQFLIPIRYPTDTLTIPVELKLSTKSWGECRPVAWDAPDDIKNLP